MKKIITVIALLAIFLPTVSFAESFKITSPAKGDTYHYGEDLNIKWTPKNKGVKIIEIHSKNTKDALGVYGPKVFGDPVNYKGYLNYKLPDYLVVRPGEYYVKTILEDDTEYKSQTFRILSKDESIVEEDEQTDNIRYALGKFLYTKKSYDTGEGINFSIQGFEEKNTLAIPSNGFHIQAHLFKKGERNPAVEAVNATYNYALEAWDISFQGIEEVGKYEVVVSLYCAEINSTSYCANKYGRNGLVEKTLQVKVIKDKQKKVNTIIKEDHFLSGDISSPVKVLTYSDIECPYCKVFHQTTRDLIEEYGDKVAFVYRHYPLYQIHLGAELAANATECTAKLGGESKFSEYLNSVFEISPDLSVETLSDLAGGIGITEKTFTSCLKSKKYSKEVKSDMKEGDKIAKKESMFGTPYSVVYGPKGKTTTIVGNQPYANIKQILDGLLKK